MVSTLKPDNSYGRDRKKNGRGKEISHACGERLGLDVGFVLWDGSTAPADLPGESFAIVIADEGVIAALLRRPKLATLLSLWVSGRVDIRNGTIFDLSAHPPQSPDAGVPPLA